MDRRESTTVPYGDSNTKEKLINIDLMKNIKLKETSGNGRNYRESSGGAPHKMALSPRQFSRRILLNSW